MVKKIIIITLSLSPIFVFGQSNKFILKGKIGNLNAPAKIYITYSNEGKFEQDSTVLKNGEFQFTNTLIEPAYAQLTLDHQGKHVNRNVDSKSLYLEPGTITLESKDSVKNVTITGSIINNDAQRLSKLIQSTERKIDSLTAVFYSVSAETQKDPEFKKDWNSKISQNRKEMRNLLLQFINENPNSYISLVTLKQVAGHQINVAEIEPIYKKLSPEIQNTLFAKRFEDAMKKTINTEVGAMAPVFTQNDVNGNPVSLTDFRGQYVLLDFWASWCGPCRAENPRVKQMYNLYKDKGFTVLGVSLDRPNAKDAWLAAIKSDGLEWTQVSDLQFWNNQAAVLYGLKSIPQNFLIDPTGKIIAKNLHGEELTQFLAGLFEKK